VDTTTKPAGGATPFVEYAPRGTLTFCGALVVLSIAFKIVGVDFEPIIDAYSEQMITQMHAVPLECEPPTIIDNTVELEDITTRLEGVEAMAHPPMSNK
jgi:hypothetical protein